MSKKILISFGFFIILLVGCNREVDIIGYVMDIKEDQILVVSSEAKDYSDTGGIKEFYDAVWVNNYPNNIEIGQQVKIWFTGVVLQSYPGQASVRKIRMVPSITPKGATLSKAEALNKALNKITPQNEIVTIQFVSYDADKDEWTILFKNTNTYEEQTVQVEDN